MVYSLNPKFSCLQIKVSALMLVIVTLDGLCIYIIIGLDSMVCAVLAVDFGQGRL